MPEDCAYFHAQFRRSNPLPAMEDHTLLDGVQGRGHYVGTYMAWGSNNAGWWGEGEIKFFMDGDKAFSTICGTGTEDYFCGAYDFDIGLNEPEYPRAYTEFCTPYAGLAQVIRPDGAYRSQQRFGLYRWHIVDPVRFASALRVTIQALGWRTDKDRRYLPLQDDISSVAFWYQTLPTAPFPTLPRPPVGRGAEEHHVGRRLRQAGARLGRCGRPSGRNVLRVWAGVHSAPARRASQSSAGPLEVRGNSLKETAR